MDKAVSVSFGNAGARGLSRRSQRMFLFHRGDGLRLARRIGKGNVIDPDFGIGSGECGGGDTAVKGMVLPSLVQMNCPCATMRIFLRAALPRKI